MLESEVAASNNPSAKGLLHNTSQCIFVIFLWMLSVKKKLVKIFQLHDVDILKPIHINVASSEPQVRKLLVMVNASSTYRQQNNGYPTTVCSVC